MTSWIVMMLVVSQEALNSNIESLYASIRIEFSRSQPDRDDKLIYAHASKLQQFSKTSLIRVADRWLKKAELWFRDHPDDERYYPQCVFTSCSAC